MKNIKQEMKKGNPMVGIFIPLPAPSLVEMAAACGYDFVIIDNEHGTVEVNGATENMIMAAYASGIYPVVRVPNIVMGSILKPLDMGAKGIHVPLINTKELAEETVSSAKYPPMGNRGTALSTRAGNYGFSPEKGRKYLDKANEDTLIVAAIETKEGIANLDDILAVPGIDAVFIGPFDLSVSLGYPTEVTHPVVVNAVKQIMEKTLHAGLQVGILPVSPAQAKEYIALGATYLPVSGVGTLNKGLQFMVQGIKG
jgi:4-hydroxy-2-oxoheptanedioate aldolase